MITISRNYIFGAIGIALLCLAVLFGMDRPPICECGTVKFWHGYVNSAENSQHLADWYTFSHIIHGFLFFWLGAWLFRKYPDAKRFGLALCLAVFLEGFWEVLENSPIIINRYREVTISWGYSGDSIVNSASDIGWMTLGFLLALRLPAWASVALALFLELLALAVIRDNLTLNVLMLLYPIDAVAAWQAAG